MSAEFQGRGRWPRWRSSRRAAAAWARRRRGGSRRTASRSAILSSSGKGEALAKELGGFGVTGSNQSNDDLKRLVDGAMERWGRIDVLVNSAGHGPRAPILEITDEEWHAGLDVYLMNVIRPTRLVAPIMQAQKARRDRQHLDRLGLRAERDVPDLGRVPRRARGLHQDLRGHYAADNVRMNNVLPGWIDSLPATEERRDSVPMRRYGTSEEIAATIAFLASEGAGYITGQNLRVDGGLMRGV